MTKLIAIYWIYHDFESCQIISNSIAPIETHGITPINIQIIFGRNLVAGKIDVIHDI